MLIDYGDDFWKIVRLHEPTPIETSTPTTNSPAKRLSTLSSSLWAASAPMPDSTPELTHINSTNHHDRGSKEIVELELRN